jgi:hypothetical protein
MPGADNVLAVASYDGNAWWDWHQMIVNSDGSMWPSWVGNSPFDRAIGSRVFFSPTGAHLQGFDVDGIFSGGRFSLAVSTTGLQSSPVTGGGYGHTVAACGDSVFAASGDIFDGETLVTIGRVTLPVVANAYVKGQAVACDHATDRLYYLQQYSDGTNTNHTTLDVLELSTQTLIGSSELPDRSGVVTQMTALGDFGVAYWITSNPYPSPYEAPQADDELFVVSYPSPPRRIRVPHPPVQPGRPCGTCPPHRH